jgi:spermidine/putrescine transport system substrate-binding protein
MAHRTGPGVTRRRVLKGAAGLTAGSLAVPLLSSCLNGPQASGPQYPIPTPDSPLKLPIFEDNPPIDGGLEPESSETLKVLNYAEYLAPAVRKGFREEFGAQVEVTPYGDFEELQRKLLEPGAEYDVVFGGPSIMSRLVFGRLIQPFNAAYLPNIKNLWPEFQDPWYDKAARYSVPYNVYSYGVGYRKDRVGEVPDNGYMMLWDPQFAGRVGIFDDAIDALSMPLVAWGISDDINTSDPELIDAAKAKLIELLALDVTVSIAQYQLIPSGQATVHQAWSGDFTFADSYTTGDTTIDDIGYWLPRDRSERLVGNETMSIPRASNHPALAHAFINYLLDEEVAEANCSWTGYFPPLKKLTADYLIDQEIVYESLRSTVVEPEDMAAGRQYTELTVPVRNVWLRAWQEFKSA